MPGSSSNTASRHTVVERGPRAAVDQCHCASFIWAISGAHQTTTVLCDRVSYPLESWQSQVRWLLALAALPLGALALAVVLPRTPLLNFVEVWPNLLAILVVFAALVYAGDKWHAG